MSDDVLLHSLSRAWSRALTVAGSDDLPREYVNVLLPLMPEVAADLLRAHRGSDFAEVFLLLDHAPLLGRHARDVLLARVAELHLPLSPVEIVASAALGVPPDERGPFRERALALLATETRPDARLGALLAWAGAETADVAPRLIAEAFALLPLLAPFDVARVVRRFGADLDATSRAALFAHVDSMLGPESDPDFIMTCCPIAPADRQLALAQQAIERAAARKDGRFISTALAAEKFVGFAPLSSWFERHLRELDSLRDLDFLLHKVGDRLPPPLLDLAEQRARSMQEGAGDEAETLAALSRCHVARREALLAELRPLVARVVGDPLAGHTMQAGEYCEYENLDVLRAAVAMSVSAAFEGDERRSLQRRALAIVERTESGFEQHHELDDLPWDQLGACLDPTLYAEAARVALALGHRPSALKALGQLVSALPESAQHLALLGMARLADGAAPEGLTRALAALDAAQSLPARASRGASLAERDAAIAALGAARGWSPPLRHELAAIASRLEAVCGADRAEWSERVAAYFDTQPWDAERMLTAVELFAPTLVTLGGARLARELSARLGEPIAPAEIARPWTQAAIGDFQA